MNITRTRVRSVTMLASLLAALGAGSAALGIERSGTAVAVTQTATATGPAGDRNLFATAPIYMGDNIDTSRSGEAQILLLDDTRLVVGPSSSMIIDEFVFQGRGKEGAVSVNAIRGAFRFITGSSQKDAYAIRTPMATIGVRGTRFDFTVTRLRLRFALYEGEATICNRLRECIVVKGPCAMIEARRFRPARPITTAEERGRLLERETFPYLARQARLQRGFRVDTSSCGLAPLGIRADGAGPLLDAPWSGGSAAAGGAAALGAAAGSERNNNGIGNGGEGGEGATETGNPGGGGGGGGGGGNR